MVEMWGLVANKAFQSGFGVIVVIVGCYAGFCTWKWVTTILARDSLDFAEVILRYLVFFTVLTGLSHN